MCIDGRRPTDTDELITLWISWLRAANYRSSATVKTYRRHIDLALTMIGKDLRDILQDDLSVYMNQFNDQRRWKASTLRVTAAALRSFFGYRSGNGRIPRNPANIIRRPQSVEREVRILRLKRLQLSQLDIEDSEIFVLIRASKHGRETTVGSFGIETSALYSVSISNITDDR